MHEAERAGLDPLPSRSGIYRALVRSGLIDAVPRRRRDEKWRRSERSRPMELWQMDVVGGIGLADGTELKALTGIDDHSRFCVSAALMPRATARPVCAAFTAALERHGIPEEILTDIQAGSCTRKAVRCSAGGVRLPGDRRLPAVVAVRSERAAA